MFENHDIIIVVSMTLGAIPAFLMGYAKGHEHGKIAGRIAYKRAKQYEQVGR
jgi:hydrogenase/urease accessory protein HupE